MAVTPNKVTVATAKAIPVFLALIILYVSYAITGPLVVEFLLNPPEGVPRRVAAGLAIVIVYYFLLIPVVVTYLRLLQVVFTRPGYVPLGNPREGSEAEPAPGLEEFWQRDVFACDARGLPIWCPHCTNWKPDRAHHNQDVGRCTLKMDHFCPWVGGVVGERSYKFFVQFNFYSFLLSAYTLTAFAYYTSKRKESASLEVQWLVALGLASFFCLFTMGMVLNSLWMTLRNVTTIENINADSRTILLAVLLPPALQGMELKEPPLPPGTHMQEFSVAHLGASDPPLTSDIDDPSHSSYFSNINPSRRPRRSSVLPYQDHIWRGTITYPLHLPMDRPPLPAPQPRTFAILETLPGMNPWDVGAPYPNFKAVFGQKLHDWLLPVKHSPCCDHSSLVSIYPLGPDFEELLVEAGLAYRPSHLPLRMRHSSDLGRTQTASRRRRRKRRLDQGWQNGERPDGWMSEKEARRVRNEWRMRMQGAPPTGPAVGNWGTTSE